MPRDGEKVQFNTNDLRRSSAAANTFYSGSQIVSEIDTAPHLQGQKQLVDSVASSTIYNPIQRTRIHIDDREIPGTEAENDLGFRFGYVMDTMAKSSEQEIVYIDALIDLFDALEEPTEWDQRQIIWLNLRKTSIEKSMMAEEDGGALEEVGDDALEDGGLAEFQKRQLENKDIVLKAVVLAGNKINNSLEGAGAFNDNLVEVRKYLHLKGSKYDEGHFLASPQKDGDINELAHSKSNGTIELFKGFFDTSTSKQADLLIHEAVHSVFGVNDYAYMWQPIFSFLPIETRLSNPDSYVAVVRGQNEEETGTPVSENPKAGLALGMIQHICMRGTFFMEVCKKQIGEFDSEEIPQPLKTLKEFRSAYNKDQLTTLINLSILAGRNYSNKVIGDKISINVQEENPTSVDAANGTLNDGIYTIDYIEHATPFLAIFVKIMKLDGVVNAAVIARSLNHLTDKNLMSSETLKPAD